MNDKMLIAMRALAAIAFISPVSLVHAQASATTPSPTASPGMSSSMSTGQRMRASQMMGSKVLGAADKKVGDIEDLVIDIAGAQVQYAVFAFDQSWFSGAKLFAFPLTAFKVQDTDDLTLDIEEGMLASMKSFDADKWGSLNDLNRDEFINPAPSSSAR